MGNTEFRFKFIVNEFAKWQIKIENLGSLNLYDANLFSENSICDIFNAIFDYNLINLNSKERNVSSIDLGDDENRISIQVTSDNSSKKIQQTLNKFFEKKYEEQYDQLFIVILGKKQTKYPEFQVSSNFVFNAEKHILDFKNLLNIIYYISPKRIEAIANILEQDIIHYKKPPKVSNATRIKKKLALRNRLKKDLLRDLDKAYWNQAFYEPWIRFKYTQAIFRSIDDVAWPEADINPKGKISSWLKCNFWDFYDNGIILLEMGLSVIFDENGYWDVTSYDDKRKQNPKYKTVSCNPFLKVPFDYIVECDMEPDEYYGLPTIYVEYAKDGMPYEEILYGLIGYYKNENDYRYVHFFDNKMRKDLP